MDKNKITIATRGSKLAIWQAEWIKSQLEALNPGIKVTVKRIKTTGDKILDVPLAQVGGKGLFVKEIEEALLQDKADIAVHSMKDVPTELPEGLHIAAVCKREDPRDAFITRTQTTEHRAQIMKTVDDLPEGATVGTSSLRRICQLLSRRPDLRITQLRGNVDTRIRKLDEGEFDAIILAAAGVKRLGRGERITQFIPQEVSLPAIGQGAVGIESRVDDKETNSIIAELNHADTAVCVKAERAFLKKLEGGCQVPIAAHARLQGRTENTEQRTQTKELKMSILIEGLVGSVSGDRIIKGALEGAREDAESLGTKLAEELLSRGADKILKEVYGS